MRTSSIAPCALALSFLSGSSLAVESTMTSAGFTGLGITPNSKLLGWGRMEAAYESQLPGVVVDPGGHNYVLGFGLLPNLELSGRLATNNHSINCLTTNCGARDLSGSFKSGISLDSRNRFHAAVGVADIGGAVTYFRSYYGVLTYDDGPLEISAGLARRSGRGINRSRSPLHGPFAAAAWQPLPLLRAHLEYSDSNVWGGVRVFAPGGWLPDGWSLSVAANLRLTNNNLTQRTWWGASLSIPLYKVPALPGTTKAPLPPLAEGQLPLPAYEARVLPPPPAPSPAPTASAAPASQPAPVTPAIAAAPSTSSTSTTVADADLKKLADALQAKGLEDIWIGRMPDTTIAVRVNNGSYGWNVADALGVTLGAVARSLSESKAGYRIILTQRQLPLVGVTGQADCLRQWIERPTNDCTAGQLSTPGAMPLEPLHEGAAWLVQQQNPSTRIARLNISPVLRTTLGTEVGAADYALGANLLASLPIWKGGSIDWGINVPLANSQDFEATGVFGQRRIRSGTDRLTLTHTMRVPLENWLGDKGAMGWGGGLSAQATVGRVGTFYDGGLAALRWEPGEGRHRLSAEAGRFRNNEFNRGLGPLGGLRRSAPLLANYRYSIMATRTDLEATAGRFMNNDDGIQIGLRQWFSDVSVRVYYRRSSFSGQAARQFAGIQVDVPIGARRDYQPLPNLQVGGTQRFAHRTETQIRAGAGNPLALGLGVRPQLPELETTFNSDRSSLVYFEDNLRRIRDAAR